MKKNLLYGIILLMFSSLFNITVCANEGDSWVDIYNGSYRLAGDGFGTYLSILIESTGDERYSVSYYFSDTVSGEEYIEKELPFDGECAYGENGEIYFNGGQGEYAGPSIEIYVIALDCYYNFDIELTKTSDEVSEELISDNISQEDDFAYIDDNYAVNIICFASSLNSDMDIDDFPGENTNGQIPIMVAFDFTNNSDDTTSFMDHFTLTAYQGDFELEDLSYDYYWAQPTAGYENSPNVFIYQGTKLPIVKAFALKNATDEVEIKLSKSVFYINEMGKLYAYPGEELKTWKFNSDDMIGIRVF